jgi:hypothetical protein
MYELFTNAERCCDAEQYLLPQSSEGPFFFKFSIACKWNALCHSLAMLSVVFPFFFAVFFFLALMHYMFSPLQLLGICGIAVAIAFTLARLHVEAIVFVQIVVIAVVGGFIQAASLLLFVMLTIQSHTFNNLNFILLDCKINN